MPALSSSLVMLDVTLAGKGELYGFLPTALVPTNKHAHAQARAHLRELQAQQTKAERQHAQADRVFKRLSTRDAESGTPDCATDLIKVISSAYPGPH